MVTPNLYSPTTALPSPAEHNSSLVYEHRSDFGDYIYSATVESWTQRRELASGHAFLLCGRGRRPSDNQIETYTTIDEQLADLVVAAIASVQPPTINQKIRIEEFTKQELTLAEVRLESDGSVVLFLNSPTGDKLDMWPMIPFSNWQIVDSCWMC